jgi:chemotaxis response regulator CheB
MGIRILIVDDHSVVRQGLQMFLALDPELEIVGEAKNGVEALHSARQLKPDVVLMDLLMPEMDGVAATEAIRRELPDVEVIALTSVLEDKAIFDAIRVAGDGGAASPGAGSIQQGDRRGPVHHRENGQDAREQRPEQTGPPQPHPGRTLRSADRAGITRRDRPGHVRSG